METHPLIDLFQSKAEVLDASGSKEGIDTAITLLAGWMDLAKSKLTEDDIAVLSDIGAILYRHGLARRL